jgi:hypothetical protein
MDWNNLFVRFFAFILLIPVISAAIAYWRRRFARSMLWNGSLPLLVLSVSVLEMFFNNTQITAGGLLFASARGWAGSMHSGMPEARSMSSCRNSRTKEFLSAIRALMDCHGLKSMIQSI